MDSFRWFSSHSSSTQPLSTQKSRRQLEKLWKNPPTQHSTQRSEAIEPTRNRWQQILHWLYQSLTDVQQVRVWTKQTKAGTVWCAYDPISDHVQTCQSENDLRAWLETRHRQ
ncbi:MAG: hypothetical protein AAFU53_02670 [Cyanobacteria bacterium J06632_3]